MTYQRVSLEFDGKIAVLKFNHPEVLNAIGAQMLGELREAVREIADPSRGARCLLLTGEGRAFCSGANLADGAGSGKPRQEFFGYPARRLSSDAAGAARPRDADGLGRERRGCRRWNEPGDHGRHRLRFQERLLPASLPAKIGLIPDGGATFLLPRLIGWGRAGPNCHCWPRNCPPTTAREWGLVNRVFEDPGAAHDRRDGDCAATGRLPRPLWHDPPSLLGVDPQLVRAAARPRSRRSRARQAGPRTSRKA